MTIQIRPKLPHGMARRLDDDPVVGRPLEGAPPAPWRVENALAPAGVEPLVGRRAAVQRAEELAKFKWWEDAEADALEEAAQAAPRAGKKDPAFVEDPLAVTAKVGRAVGQWARGVDDLVKAGQTGNLLQLQEVAHKLGHRGPTDLKTLTTLAQDVERIGALQKDAQTLIASGKHAQAAAKLKQAATAAKALKLDTLAANLLTQTTRTANAARTTVAAAQAAQALKPAGHSRYAKALLLTEKGLAASRGAGRGVKAAAVLVGKALGRLTPGLNIAIAALDTYQFYNDMKDPKASPGKKLVSGLNALLSVTAASNIPFVSQAAGLVSIGTSLLRGWL